MDQAMNDYGSKASKHRFVSLHFYDSSVWINWWWSQKEIKWR